MNLRRLEAFLAVVEAGSFSRAGERLGLAQSTVSAHVAALERACGLELLDRSGRSVRASRAGLALLPHAREAAAAVRRGAQSITALRVGGDLLLAASTIPAAYLVPAWVARFLSVRPGVRVAVRAGDSREAAASLLEGACDLAITGARPAGRALRAVRVAEDRLVLAVPARHPLSGRRSCRPQDLRGMPFVGREAGSGTREAVEAALRGSGLDPKRDMRIVCELGSTEAVAEAVRAGLGAAILSSYAVRDLKTVPLEGFPDRRAIWLLSVPGRSLPPAAAAFAAMLRRG